MAMTRREREVTDPAKILDILKSSKVVHLGLCDGVQPYVVPMNYGFDMREGRLTLYVHGARQGRKYDVMSQNPRVSFAMECDLQPFSGPVACKYGMSYSCLMGEGTAATVEDPAEKCRALSLIMRTQTGEDFEFDDKLASVVRIVRIDVESYSAKHRPLPV